MLMDCAKCPVAEECKKMKEDVKDTAVVKAFRKFNIEFCPLVYVMGRALRDINEV